MRRDRIIFSLLFILGIVVVGIWHVSSTPKSLLIDSDQIANFIDDTESLLLTKPNTLIVLDIDDTIYESAMQLGTPTWFYGMIRHLREQGIKRERVSTVLSDIDFKIQPHMRVNVIENELVDAIASWQKRAKRVVALTSRPDFLASATQNQLSSVGIQFHDPIFPCIEARWNKGHGAFINGVLHVNELRKSSVLEHFIDALEKCGGEVNAIAHADDQKKYVREIEELAQKRKLDFLGIIYGRAIHKREFDIHKANQELEQLEADLQIQLIPNDLRPFFIASEERAAL